MLSKSKLTFKLLSDETPVNENGYERRVTRVGYKGEITTV